MPAIMTRAYEIVRHNLELAAEQQERQRRKTSFDKQIKIGDLVLLYSPRVPLKNTKKLSKMSSGPWRVLKKLSEVNYKICLVSNPHKTEIVHVDRLTKLKERRTFFTPVEVDAEQTLPKEIEFKAPETGNEPSESDTMEELEIDPRTSHPIHEEVQLPVSIPTDLLTRIPHSAQPPPSRPYDLRLRDSSGRVAYPPVDPSSQGSPQPESGSETNMEELVPEEVNVIKQVGLKA